MNNNFSQPFENFKIWFDEATKNPQIVEPTAMCLSCIDENNLPNSRMVLLKAFDERGFCFYTNFNSRKAASIKANNRVALCFYWGILGRQVRIEGEVTEVTKQEADDYFASRRRESRIGAWASKQSSEMKDWSEFENRIAEFTEKFSNSDVPRPDFWSGFRVNPSRIEFWQEGDFRIHRREVFIRKNSDNKDSTTWEKSWEIKKLYP